MSRLLYRQPARRAPKTFARVAVRAADGTPLAPCHAARARALLRAGRAVLVRRRPPLILLREPVRL
jgi:hypothetical protein